MINAASEIDIVLLKNTTEGICTMVNGIDWRPGDNLVIPAGEFPSNRLPWLALERLGVEVREVDIRSTDEPEHAIFANMDEHTRQIKGPDTYLKDRKWPTPAIRHHQGRGTGAVQ